MDVDIFDEKGLSIQNTKGELFVKNLFPPCLLNFGMMKETKNIKLHILKNIKCLASWRFC